MSSEELVSKYIDSADYVLKHMKILEGSREIEQEDIGKVIEYAERYLTDAKYYRDKKKFEVGLASVAYCEGMLDTLKLLGAVKFEWPIKKKGNTREK